MLDAAAVTAANRFGLGARPGELASIGAAGRDWLRAQLRAPPPVLAAPELRSSQQVLAQALELRRERAGASARRCATATARCRRHNCRRSGNSSGRST